ncbi:MAG: peptidylprolyl isomerase [Bacteroidales bacterium]
MAIIGKIRSYSGLLVIVIGVALAAFVLGDLFKNSGRRSMPPLAEIEGEEITNQEFQKHLEDFKERYRQQLQKQNLSTEENFQAMQSAWENMLMENIMREQYDELGLAVKHDPRRKASISSAELNYLLTSDNPHEFIRQIGAFQDQQTGQVNPALVQQFISMLDQQDQETQRQWIELEKQIKESQLRNKYYSLIEKGYYLPNKLAEVHHHAQSDRSEVMVAGLLYRSIPDTAITITDEDYQEYYDEHKNELKVDQPSATITYVKFDVNPSNRDYQIIQTEAQNYFRELKNAEKEDVSTIIGTLPANDYDSTYYKQGELETRIDTALFDAEPGTMVSIYQQDGAFHTARLMEMDTRPDSMRASHILVRYGQDQEGNMIRTPEEAENKTDSLLELIQDNPQQFETIAQTESDDPQTGEKGGDTDWFPDGRMVYPFNQGVMDHEVGDIFKVETRFGYHIIKVTGKTEPIKKMRVATLTIPIEPTQETYDSVWAIASEFLANNQSVENFKESVSEQNLETRERTINPMTGTIPGIGSARAIARWVFDEKTKPNTVAENIFEGDESYVAVMLEEKLEAGIPPLDNVKDRIKTLVAREVKARVLSEKFNRAMQNENNMITIARQVETELDTFPNITFASPNIPKFGPEPKLVGLISKTKENTITGPVKGQMGVYIFNVINHFKAPEVDNYARVRQQKQNEFNQVVRGNGGMGGVFNALKDITDIEDNRIMYY